MLEELRWKKFKVLNDGFVCLVDVMGTDGDVVSAARVSYGAGTKHTSDDRTLIRYLMRHRHTTPFEMAELKFLVRVPMDCWRQWIRHRMASVNEYSTRYSEAIDSQQVTLQDKWRLQDGRNKQGSGEFLTEWTGDDGKPMDDNDSAEWQVDHAARIVDRIPTTEPASPGRALSVLEARFHRQARELYDERLKMGVAREQARKDLPLSTYTEAYWKIDLHNLFHFLSLRMDPHAQLEIRSYANVIGREIVRPLFPLCWEAFEDHRLGAVTFSRLELDVLRAMVGQAMRGNPAAECEPEEWRGKKQCRERDEFDAKLERIGWNQSPRS